jgi:ABC-type sugar transport system permease subunit
MTASTLVEKSAKKGLGPRRAEKRFIITALVPTVLFYLIFRFYPVGQALYMSLFDYQLMRKVNPFIGLKNYVTILTDSLFLKVIWNTFYYAFGTAIFITLLAFILAVILNPLRRGSVILRLIYYLPTVTSAIAISTIWLFLYQPQFGLFNQTLSMLGIPHMPWLTTPAMSMPSLIIMSVWGGVGFSMVILIAGLRGIPVEYYDAAAIDGASTWQRVWHITLPLVSPIITFVFITGLIDGFNIFQSVYVMTRGGPLDSTRVLALHIYEYAFKRLWIGQASAMAFVMFALLIALTVMQLRLQREDLGL